MVIFAYLLLVMTVPVFYFQDWKAGPGSAGAHSGDEPHYLAMLNSMVLDGDLDLRNDYAKKRYGRKLSRYTLDHHTYFVHRASGRRIAWEQVYGIRKNARGDDFEIFLRPGAPRVHGPGWIEYPLHPVGYPLLLAPPALVFSPAGDWDYESILIFLQLVCLAFVSALTARRIGVGPGDRLLYILLLLSFPVWVYAASFFPEALAAPLFLGAVLAVREERFGWLGLCVGALVLIKDIYIPVGMVLAGAPLFAFRSSGMGGLVRFALPAGAAVGLFLFKNWYYLGHPLTTYVPFRFEADPVGALSALLVSPHKGVLAFSPVLILVPFYLKRYLREHAREGMLVLTATAVLVGITVLHANWSGGPSFAYRTIAPAIFMFLPMLFRGISRSPNLVRRAALLLAFVGTANMFYAATHLKHSYSSPAYFNLVSPTASHWLKRFR